MADPTSEAVYIFIRDYIREHHYSPTIREISKACYVSRSNVIRYLVKLEELGLIQRDPGVPRSISLVGSPVDS
jgi:SOS-response transcriptional repressor LexA